MLLIIQSDFKVQDTAKSVKQKRFRIIRLIVTKFFIFIENHFQMQKIATNFEFQVFVKNICFLYFFYLKGDFLNVFSDDIFDAKIYFFFHNIFISVSKFVKFSQILYTLIQRDKQVERIGQNDIGAPKCEIIFVLSNCIFHQYPS